MKETLYIESPAWIIRLIIRPWSVLSWMSNIFPSLSLSSLFGDVMMICWTFFLSRMSCFNCVKFSLTSVSHNTEIYAVDPIYVNEGFIRFGWRSQWVCVGMGHVGGGEP